MITLIGHGYIGQAIWQELEIQSYLPAVWIHHTAPIPPNTQVIINAAGYTGSPNVDACENFKQDTVNGNVAWPLKLEYRFPNTPIVHISSGCVYTGYDKKFTEEDPPNFTFDNGSFYSGTKALAQELLMPYMHKSYLLRIRMPFGKRRHPKNLLTKLEKYNKLIDFENSLSYVPDVARFAVECALQRFPYGIYNVCNPGSKTTRQIADAMKLNKEWFTKDEFAASVAAPRSNCVLSTDKIEKIYKIKHIDDALLDAIAEYN
jgi:3,5-epimerase/4-reductase